MIGLDDLRDLFPLKNTMILLQTVKALCDAVTLLEGVIYTLKKKKITFMFPAEIKCV